MTDLQTPTTKNGETEMAGTMRLKGDLYGRHNRRNGEQIDRYFIQSYLRSALATADNWLEDPAQYQRVDLDHLYAYLTGVLGIPVSQLRKMRLEEVFDFLDKKP